MKPAFTGLSGLFLLFSLINCSTNPENELLGYWQGELDNNGQQFTMAMEFFPDSSQMAVDLIFPEYGWKFSFNGATINDSIITIGSSRFIYNKERKVVTGTLPSGFVPVLEIKFELSKTENRAPFIENKYITSTRQPDNMLDLGEGIWAGLNGYGGNLYAGTLKGNFYSIRANDLSVNWKQETGGEIRGKALVHDGFSYLYSDDGTLHKISPAGKSIWTFDAGLDTLERIPANYDFYSGMAAFNNEKIYFGNGAGNVFVVNDQDGKEITRYNTNGPVRSDLSFDNQILYFSSFDGSVNRVEPESTDPSVVYKSPLPIAGGPAIYGDNVIFGDRMYYLTAINKNSGVQAWQYYYWFSWIESGPVVFDNKIYVGSSDSQMLNVLNPEDGSLIWKFDTGGCPWSSPLVTDDNVFVATVGTEQYFTKHYAYLICLDRNSGRELWRFSIDPEEKGHYGFAGSPILFNGKVWVASTSGKIYEFSL